jgi:hypothetical protein
MVVVGSKNRGDSHRYWRLPFWWVVGRLLLNIGPWLIKAWLDYNKPTGSPLSFLNIHFCLFFFFHFSYQRPRPHQPAHWASADDPMLNDSVFPSHTREEEYYYWTRVAADNALNRKLWLLFRSGNFVSAREYNAITKDRERERRETFTSLLVLLCVVYLNSIIR